MELAAAEEMGEREVVVKKLTEELVAEEMTVLLNLLLLERVKVAQGQVVLMEKLAAEVTALLIPLLERMEVAQGQVVVMEELAAVEEVLVLLILLRTV